jgi:hypothetical protein
MKNYLKTIFLALALILSVSVAYSQGGIPLPDAGDDVNDEAPVSSLVVLGLVAGAVYGVKKLK